MDIGQLLQIFIGLGGFAGAAALVSVVFTRKKLAAESRDIAQNTSDKVISNLERENQRQAEKLVQYEADIERIMNLVRELRDRISVYDIELSELRVLAMGTINWSRRASQDLQKASEALEKAGIDITLIQEAPPDPKRLMAKFEYIEERVTGQT